MTVTRIKPRKRKLGSTQREQTAACPVCGSDRASAHLHIQEDVALNEVAKAAVKCVTQWSAMQTLSRHKVLDYTAAISNAEFAEAMGNLLRALDEFYAIPTKLTPTINSLLEIEHDLERDIAKTSHHQL